MLHWNITIINSKVLKADILSIYYYSDENVNVLPYYVEMMTKQLYMGILGLICKDSIILNLFVPTP